MLIIDCHAHIYSEDEKQYPPIEEPYRPPPGKGTLAHLHREMTGAGVSYATAIQTSTFYKWDNRFTVAASKVNRAWLAGVCTLDPDDPHSPGLLEQYVREANVRGLRSIPAASGKLADPGVLALWQAAQKLGIVVNVLVNRDKRRELAELLEKHRGLTVVLDHCLNIAAGEQLEATLSDVVALAEHPNLFAKLTFIPTGSAQEYPCRDLHDACRAVIEAFGADRCVWGSDFPCELWCPKVTYREHLKIFTDELGLDPEAKAAILGQTARRLWFADREEK